MARLFGTDGVRGLANGHLTAELAVDLSVAAAHVLGEAGVFSGHRPVAVVGRDTRISGQFLEAAVVAGLASAGVDVLLLGVLPTPGVAYLTDALGADLGVMLSASHNPMPDNGIKFLARGGVKLDDAIETAIEKRLREPWDRPTGAGVGRVSTYDEAVERYAAHLVSTLPRRLDTATGSEGRRPIKVVLDCAHGAAYEAGPQALRDAGAEVVAICAEPDGLNINDGCGSTHLDVLQKAVVEHGADVGFALDGDADRCLAVDADGAIVEATAHYDEPGIIAKVSRGLGTAMRGDEIGTLELPEAEEELLKEERGVSEIPFDQPAFLARVKDSVERYDYCVVVVSEGAKYPDGRFLAEAGMDVSAQYGYWDRSPLTDASEEIITFARPL